MRLIRALSAALLVLGICAPAFPSDIYWTRFAPDGTGSISRTDTATMDSAAVIPTGLRYSYRIAVDPGADYVFWSSLTTGATGGIRRANLDGSGMQTIVSTAPPAQAVAALAVDAENQKIIYGQANSSLRRANYDGTQVETFFTPGNVFIQDIAVDPIHEAIYFSDYSGTITGVGRVRRINFDGTGLQDVVTGIPTGPIGLAVDPVGGKLYWGRIAFGTQVEGSVQRANLDGSGVETIVAEHDVDSLALDVAAGKIYWTDNEDFDVPSHIWRSNLDGSDVEQTPITSTSIGGITIVPEPASAWLAAIMLFLVSRRAARGARAR